MTANLNVGSSERRLPRQIDHQQHQKRCKEATVMSQRSFAGKSGTRRPALGVTLLAGTLMSAAGAVHAQSAAGPVPKPADDSLTLHGITLYGIVDAGIQYDTHGAPFNDYHPATSSDIVQKDSAKYVIGATSSNLSQSRVGLMGIEPLNAGDWYGIFRLETFFNPTSGDISDALKSQTQNAGRTAANQTTNLDSSIAGQIFQQSFVGVSSRTFGSFTFGRQNTILADGFSKYDPQGGSQAFSLIGLSGTFAGGGDTEDRRLDDSLKYVTVYGPLHAGAEYKFNNAHGNNGNTAIQATVGAEYLGASVDGYYSKVNSAISTSTLTAAQVADLPGLGYSVDKSLSGTISDNTTLALMALYNIPAPMGAPKVYASYEHIVYTNPSDPLPVGFDDIGGYKLAFVNNKAFPHDKVLDVYWFGGKYTLLSKLDLTAAFYGLRQNSYGEGANAGCKGTTAGTCSGDEKAITFSADYRFTKRFDVYAGGMYTSVQGGLANGFLLNTNNFDPTIGFRFRF
jgi:predicted porin